jgi:hypothetical protein
LIITSPHNDQLKEIRKLANRRWRDRLGEFVAEGEDLLTAADAPGWEPRARLVAEDSGLAGDEVAPDLLAPGVAARLRHPRHRRVRAGGRRRRPARCAWR